MFKGKTSGLLIALASVWVVALPVSHAKEYVFATATTGGTYYPMGDGAATLWSLELEKKHGITVVAKVTAGSVENIELLRGKKADLAILGGIASKQATRGEGPYKGKTLKNVRTIAVLWPDVEHFVIRKDKAKTGTIQDIVGLKYYVGLKGSGTERSTMMVLEGLGLDTKSVKRGKLDYYKAAKAINDNNLDGASMPGGPPVGAVSALFASGVTQVVLLRVTRKQVKEIVEKTGYPGIPFVIRRGTYPGLRRSVMTIAQPNILVVRADIPEKVVYLLTKILFENTTYMRQVHAMGAHLKLKKALAGLPAPLHPGAYKYFKEKRLKIPASLAP